MGNCNCKHGAAGTATACPECDILQMARNNYFTGKLLVERDFTDEQRYGIGKLRRHNQRLHGWGVACGFKVKEHPNPACQSQYVVVEPGTAIDCCGREILLQCEDYFDFESRFLANWQIQNGANSQPDSNTHTLQICVSYRECPTEQVPAIFDDCSAGGGSCQPNRILEGYSLDVIIDPADSNPDPQGVSLQWEFTKNIANAMAVAEDEDSKRLYVLTSATSGGTSNAAIYVIDTQHYALMASATFANSAGLDVAVDSSGAYIYVAVQPTAAGAAPQVYVYAAAGDFTTTVNQVAVGNTGDSTTRLIPSPGTEGGLLAWGKTAGFVVMQGLNAAGPSQVVTSSPISPVSVVLSENTQYGYVASGGSNSIAVIQISGEAVTVTPWTIALPAAAQPASLAIRSTNNGEILAALDTSGNTLYFATIPSAGPGSATVLTQTVTPFPYSPLQVLLSPGGRWAYVLEQDKTGSSPTAYVQAVDVHAVESNETAVLGPAVAVGIGPMSEALAQNGHHLYIPFVDTAQPNLSGVAIVDIAQADCGDIFKCLIEGCPDCAQGNCLVLATITGYVYQGPITSKMIHNLRGRRLLPSTDLLTKAVQCLIDQTPSTGPAGATGATGAAGPGFETGLVQISALSWTHAESVPLADVLQTVTLSASLTSAQGGLGTGTTFYNGTFSPVFPTGSEVTITGFSNAANNGTFTISSCSNTQLIAENGNGVTETAAAAAPANATAPSPAAFVLAFNNGGVQMPKPQDAPRIFQVLVDPVLEADQAQGFENHCAVAGTVIAVSPTISGTSVTAATQVAVAPGSAASALAFVLDPTKEWYAELAILQMVPNRSVDVWVRVRGDFLLDTAAVPRAISAEFVRAQLPTGDRPPGSGLCLEGGTFESWLTLVSGGG